MNEEKENVRKIENICLFFINLYFTCVIVHNLCINMNIHAFWQENYVDLQCVAQEG